MVHPVQLGRTTRMSYSRINEVLEMPNLIEIQKNSYEWFLEEGLKEVLKDVSPINDYTGNLVMEFIGYSLDMDNIKYSVEECKERDTTYSAPLKVKVRLINKETGEVKEQEIFMGDFPLMTRTGTFVINGAERVIVSQLVRSPGIYYSVGRDKIGKKLYSNTVIPNRGTWLEYETDSNNIAYVRIDRTRKLPITVLLRALGYGTDAQLLQLFGESEMLLATIQKDNTKSEEEGLLEVYKRLRPGEPPTVESASNLLTNLFFEPRRYDLSRVGRYKFNKKLALATRIRGQVASADIADAQTGEILVDKGDTIPYDIAIQIQNSGINIINIELNGRNVKVVGNNTVDIQSYINFEASSVGITENVRYDVLQQILKEYSDDEGIKRAIDDNRDLLIPKTITIEDIVASVNYIFNLVDEVGNLDDIDHLGNRRLRSVGELLQNQFRIGLSRMERVVRERMTIQDIDIVTPQQLINIRPVTAAIKEFFGSSQLSQFMDQTNPLAELTHKRRSSALGPGGLSRERAGFEVRDVHHSHYGRMCPIETPEGPNIGLIGSLSSYAHINEYGFIESPYRRVDKKTTKVTDEVFYMTADEEDGFIIAEANEPLDKDGYFVSKRIGCRYRNEIREVNPENVDFMDVSPKQLVSVATAMIPFFRK